MIENREMEEIFSHFRYSNKISDWLDSLDKYRKKQIFDVFVFGNKVKLDWYITRDAKTIRCGRKHLNEKPADDILIRIRPTKTDGTIYFYQDVHFKEKCESKISSLNKNLEILNKCISRLGERHRIDRNEGYFPDDYQYFDFTHDFQDSVNKSLDKNRNQRLIDIKKYKQTPKEIRVTRRMFIRNPDVVAESLYIANGNCGCCGKQAPFSRISDGRPYLEVHHKKPLSEGGLDTVENTIALCPNCHRHQHFGKNPKTL